MIEKITNLSRSFDNAITDTKVLGTVTYSIKELPPLRQDAFDYAKDGILREDDARFVEACNKASLQNIHDMDALIFKSIEDAQ